MTKGPGTGGPIRTLGPGPTGRLRHPGPTPSVLSSQQTGTRLKPWPLRDLGSVLGHGPQFLILETLRGEAQ